MLLLQLGMVATAVNLISVSIMSDGTILCRQGFV